MALSFMNKLWLGRTSAATTYARLLGHFLSTRSFHSSSTIETIQQQQQPKVPLQGQFKNPIVAKLWALRQEAKDRLGVDSDATTTTTTKSAETQLEPKTPSQSATAISYPFSTDEYLLELYRNPWGQMRFGKILEDLDALAGNIAFHHVEGNPLIVTAGVDRISLRRRPQIGCDQHLSGQVTWVGSSSMEIRMTIQDDGGAGEWIEAYTTFVTLDPLTKKPVSMPPLRLKTELEHLHFNQGAARAKLKKIARKQRSVQVGQPMSEASIEIETKAAELLQEAAPLISMPSLADPHAILMNQTGVQNAMIAQPQLRNLSERIFGGFLMRRAFELAFANCYMFGGAKPLFLEVGDVSFEQPVDVGDLLSFKSRVLYTMPDSRGFCGSYVELHPNQPLIMMEVEAWVTEPEKVHAYVSNIFHFTFALPAGTPCRKVLPSNMEDARRMARRMAANQEQASATVSEQ